MGLELLAEGFEDKVADGGGEEADGEVAEGQDVVEREGKGLAGAVGVGEFAHEEVGVEEEEDEGDLDDRAPERGEKARGIGVAGHEGIVQNGGGVPGVCRDLRKCC